MVRGLWKRYDDKVAVAGIDLDVPRACFFGLVGPNGAGKTTMIRMLTGLLRPDAGQVWVEGVDVWADPVVAKARIGVLPDEFRLFDRLTGSELLEYCGLLRGMPLAVIEERAVELLDILGLADASNTLVIDYSTGMRKKIALASALLHAPEVLFLDEPFEAVDPVSTRALHAVLERFTDTGNTVVFSSHVMEVVERLCDRVGVVHLGRLIAEGPIDELRAGRRLEDVFVDLVGAHEDQHAALGWLGGHPADPPRVPTAMSSRSGGAPPIPAVMVRLKWRLLRNRRRQRGGTLGLALGSVLALLCGVTGFLWSILAGHASDPRVSRAVVVLGATALLVGWAILPLLSFGTDETLDPARLQLLPLAKRPLIRGLLLSTFIGYAPFAVLLTMTGVVVGYARSAAGALVTLATVALLALLSAATARTLATALAATITSRRGRDVLIGLGALLAVSLQLVRLVHLGNVDAALLDRLSNIARWLPPGALGQAIIDARTGRLARSVAELIPASIALPLLLAAWGRALDRSLTVVAGGSTSARVTAGKRRSSSLFPRGVPFLRPNRWGAVAAKELRYVARDPRRKIAFAQLLVLGVGGPIWFAIRAGSLSPGSVLIASLAGYIALLGASNQFGFDGGALWLDIVAGNRIHDELIGKNAALLVQLLPIVLLGSIVLAAFSGGWLYVPVALVIAAAGLGAGLAVANVMSVRFPQRIPETKSPFGGTGGGQGCVTTLVFFAGIVAQGVLLSPVAIASALCVAFWPTGLIIVAPACALYGYVLWRQGTAMAERWAWWRQPELLLAVDPRRGS